MQKIVAIADQFRKEEDGAALIEYSILIGLITVAVILTVVAVGGWVNGRWTALNSTLTNATAN